MNKLENKIFCRQKVYEIKSIFLLDHRQNHGPRINV